MSNSPILDSSGPKGDQGDQGIQGPQGDKGDQGDPGDASDHLLLANIGTNTHAQLDTHVADGSIHPPVTGFVQFEALTQAEYDALTPDANTIYFIRA